ncbi:MAG: hypothetical protein ACLFTK_03235 [Anaerolineales bacterium]
MFLSDDPQVVERDFRQAYVKRHGKSLKEFQRLENGQYLINGISFTELEVWAMLDTLQTEIAEHDKTLVKRLINFFKQRF